MEMWYMTVETPDGEIEANFYHCDQNPLEKYPERFGHKFIELVGERTIFDYVDEGAVSDEAVEKDDIRYAVDELDTDTEYYIVDAHGELGDYFPSVPDVPGHPSPTFFVAVPRDKVLEVSHR